MQTSFSEIEALHNKVTVHMMTSNSLWKKTKLSNISLNVSTTSIEYYILDSITICNLQT